MAELGSEPTHSVSRAATHSHGGLGFGFERGAKAEGPGPTQGLSIWLHRNFWGHALPHLATRGCVRNSCGFRSCWDQEGSLPGEGRGGLEGLGFPSAIYCEEGTDV